LLHLFYDNSLACFSILLHLFSFIFSTWQLQYFLALSLLFFSFSFFQLGDFYTFWHSAWFSFHLHLFNLATSILFGTQLGFLFIFIFSTWQLQYFLELSLLFFSSSSFSTWRLQYFLALSLVFFSSSSFQLGDFYTFWHSAWFSFPLHLFNLAISILFGTQLGFLYSSSFLVLVSYLANNGRVQPLCGAQRSKVGCNPLLAGIDLSSKCVSLFCFLSSFLYDQIQSVIKKAFMNIWIDTRQNRLILSL